MRKGFKLYLAVWSALFVVFIGSILVTPHEFAGFNKFLGSFWSGYIGILVVFLSQLICSVIAFYEDDNQKFFYNIPLIRISYTGLILTFIVGGICMAIPNLPLWVGALACGVVLLFNIISVIKAKTAANIVSDIDESVKYSTAFIKTYTAKAENLVATAKAPMLKNECKKVYEAFRYSDPISNEALEEIEFRIAEEFDTLLDAVISDDLTLTESASKQVVLLIKERASLCKLHK